MSTTPDYVRIGPPYGQVNELQRSSVYSTNSASADVGRVGVRGWWGVDGWVPVASDIHPASAQASWAVTPAAQTDAGPGGPWGGVYQWTIRAATAMPPSAIIARATVLLPYAATAMYVFEMAGAATFAAFPVVPEFMPANYSGAGPDLVASANGSVIGSTPAITGSNPAFQFSRAFQQTLGPISAVGNNDTEQDLFTNWRYKTIQIRTVGSVASGAQLSINYLRLAALPVPAASYSGAPASAALALASSLVGTFHRIGQAAQNGAVWTGQYALSRPARWPPLPGIDANQPEGQAYEIGSAMIAGQVEWGGDLVKQTYANSILTQGDPIAFEEVPNRSLKFPYINRDASSNPYLFARNIERVLKSGNVVDVIPEFANPTGYMTRFDIIEGRAVYQEDVRYSRAGLARGTIEVMTAPYGRSATYVTLQFNKGAASAPTSFFVAGDVPAPAFYGYSDNSSVATGGTTGQNVPMLGFMGVIVPADLVPSYYPVTMTATHGNTAASMPNGYRTVGSQNYFQMATNAENQIARGYIPQTQSAALTQRTRVFAVMANASAATIPVRMVLTMGAVSTLATAISQIGYSSPLYTPASEMPQMHYVDLGEVRTPLGQSAATVGWELICATGGVANATAGVFDSLLFMPVSDPRTFFGVVPSGRGANGLSNYTFVTATSAVFVDGNMLPIFDADADLPNWYVRNAAIDMTPVYQGRAPFMTPGVNHFFVAPIGNSTNASKARPFSVGSTPAQTLVYYYPRWLFMGGR